MQERISHYRQLVNYEKQQFVTDLYYGAITNPDQIQKRITLLSGTAQDSTYILMQIALIHDEHCDSFLDSYGIDAFQNQLLQLLNSFHPAFESILSAGILQTRLPVYLCWGFSGKNPNTGFLPPKAMPLPYLCKILSRILKAIYLSALMSLCFPGWTRSARFLTAMSALVKMSPAIL